VSSLFTMSRGPTFTTAPGAPPPGAVARAFALAPAQGCRDLCLRRLRRSALLGTTIRSVRQLSRGPTFIIAAGAHPQPFSLARSRSLPAQGCRDLCLRGFAARLCLSRLSAQSTFESRGRRHEARGL